MYSQNEEEKYILEYFKDRKGIFLEIGANDGITLSNTRALVDIGWNGVFVEPSPEAFRLLKNNAPKRKGLYYYNFALGLTNKKVKFQDSGTHLKKGDVGLLSTMDETNFNKWRPTTQYTEMKVKCFRWKTFLNRLKYKSFDFISIDTEGMDLAILTQIDLKDTSCICVEWNNDNNLKAEFDALTTGFKIIYQSLENLIYGR